MRAGTVAAVDLGATSGRVIVGRLGEGGLRLRQVARFPNDPVRTTDGLHWNLLELYRQALAGLAAAEREAPGEISGVGVDSWAVDYGLLREGRLLGIPYHYRSGRNDVAAVHAHISPADLYGRNGLQHQPFNTLFQLAAEGELLTVADRMLLIPDLLNFWLTGTQAAERTNASTTGLLSPRTREWDAGLARLAGIPARILSPLADPGTPLGPLTTEAAAVVGRPLGVITVASHDTASAVAAVPARGRDFAYVSCGTWGLAGLELDQPVFSEDARKENFTNEGGVDGRTRFLRNVTGLWLLAESLRSWDPAATDAQRSSRLRQLLGEAAQVTGRVVVFDVNDPVFLPPGDIPGRIEAWCRDHGEPVPRTPAEFTRSIVESIAQAFADAVRTAARLAGRDVPVIHIVGGGTENELLCQATANRSGLPVLAGPAEATAVGNILVQARALGMLSGDLEDLRAVAARSFAVARYHP